MEDDKVEQHEQLDFFNFNLTVLAQAWEEDIYLRLSAYGMMVFCVLCALIVVCWFRYEATISDMIDTKNYKAASIQRSQSSSNFEGSKSYYVPWQQETFVLSPETKKVEQLLKKRR